MKKEIISRIDSLGYVTEVEYFRDPFWCCNYVVDVYDRHGELIDVHHGCYFIDAKDEMFSKETFQRELDKFISSLP